MKTRHLFSFAIASVFTLALTGLAADNVILFVGDGMGTAHITAGRAFVNGNTVQPSNSRFGKWGSR